MTIDQIWRELEAESRSPSGWIARQARPRPSSFALHVALDQKAKCRALLLPIPQTQLPPRSAWPECAGLDLAAVTVAGVPHVSLKLRDASTGDVFTVLAEYLADRLDTAPDPATAVALLFNQLGRWQLFLTAFREGLGAERQRGLFGELLLACDFLAPRISMALAIDAWRGSTGAHQDFLFPRGAIEVKTSAAKQPTAVRISSERQLDLTGVGSLFLHVFLLDERDVGTAPNTDGESLAALVARIRGSLSADALLRSRFEDRLLLAGWLDAHVARYQHRRWSLRTQSTFRIAEGFPRIVEGDLRPGVGDVSYALDLAACAPFLVPFDDLVAALL